MRTGLVGIAALGVLVTADTARAQVQADVVIDQGPVAARVHVGRPAISYYEPVVVRRGPRRVVLVERPVTRVILVERIGHRGKGWWKRHGYRPVTVWYDGARFYDRRFRMHGIREVVVFERGGQYFVMDDRYDRHERYDQYGRYDDDGYDRHDRYDRDGRYDRRDREWDD
jgi:hypothetical protein